MAIGTGFVVGYFSSVIIIIYAPPINGIIGSSIAFAIYQFISFDRFFGSRRGEFEYEYRNDLADKKIKKLVFKAFGFFTYVKYFQDQFNALRTAQQDICLRLLKVDSIIESNENLYCIYYKLSDIARREDNFEKEKKMLSEAISHKLNDFLVCYRLAVYCELDGLVEDAIKYYKLASNNPNLISKALRKFILSQVERIELKGPMNRPPVLGARY